MAVYLVYYAVTIYIYRMQGEDREDAAKTTEDRVSQCVLETVEEM